MKSCVLSPKLPVTNSPPIPTLKPSSRMPTQLLSFNTALVKKSGVSKLRNLGKSVTEVSLLKIFSMVGVALDKIAYDF